MKKLSAFVLATALTGSLLMPAFAAAPSAITVNGKALDTTGLPDVAGIPMRLLAESDHGAADWFQEDNAAMFYLDDCTFFVNFADLSVERDGAVLENVKANLVAGVTYLPVEAFDGVESYKVEITEDAVAITTPSSDPLVNLAYTIADAGEVGYGMKASEEILTGVGINPECFTEYAGFFPMMVVPDTVLVGKLAEGKEDEARANVEAFRKQQEETFTWYLNHNLPKVQDARVVVKDGYMLFTIAENADAAVAAFEAGLAAVQG